MNQARVVAGKILKTTAYPRPNPSIVHFPGLTAKPIWRPENTPNFQSLFPFVDFLESNFARVKEEFQNAKTAELDDYQPGKTEHQLHLGQWRWINYIAKGKLVSGQFSSIFPEFQVLLQSREVQDHLVLGVPFSYGFYSIMKPKTHIKPHFGPCNFRLRCHMALNSPEGSFLKVAGETVRWKEGKILIFDDSYEHEAANLNEESERTLFLFDIWHPDLTVQERIAIKQLFQEVERIQQARGSGA